MLDKIIFNTVSTFHRAVMYMSSTQWVETEIVIKNPEGEYLRSKVVSVPFKKGAVSPTAFPWTPFWTVTGPANSIEFEHEGNHYEVFGPQCPRRFHNGEVVFSSCIQGGLSGWSPERCLA